MPANEIARRFASTGSDETRELDAKIDSIADEVNDAVRTLNTEVASAATGDGTSYTPATSGDWSGDPTTVEEALDRIAAAIAAGTTGVPIA